MHDILEKYREHTSKWIAALDEYNDTAFTFKPEKDEWSVSEVCDHIVRITDKCLRNALACSENKGETGHSGFGPAIFSLMGSFPPVRIKVKKIPPGLEVYYNPKQITMAEAKLAFELSLKKMEEALPQVMSADKDQRIAHWAGGWFNACQWFQSAEMHIKHHFRQKRRIDKALKNADR